MVKIISNERNDLIMHLTDLQEQHRNNYGLKSLIEVLTIGKEDKTPEGSKINEDGSINLHVYSLYKLYHYTVNLESEENQKREEILEVLNPKLDALLTGVPKFFKDAFESRELYLHSNGSESPSSFF